MKARFVREAQSAAALYHPNICTVYAIEEWEGQLLLAMAFVDGVTLKERIDQGALDPQEVVRIAIQVASGLETAHARGIVHRDIKSSNIMLAPGGRALILDFGLARSPQHPEVQTGGATMGTVAYMSPEQVRGEPVDSRTDLWSLGVVLYELLTGELPFPGGDEAAVFHAILESAPSRLNETREGLAGDLAQVIGRTLAKGRNRRYSTASEVLIDLRSLQANMGGRTVMGFASPSSPPLVSEQKPAIAVLPFANLSGDPAHEYFCDGLAEELIHSLAHLQGLRVVARTSSFSFRETSSDVREIGRKLNVERLVEGSVRMAGNRLRITAQLVSTADGSHLWSERYDRDFGDLFAIQDDIALAIVNEIKPRLLKGDREKLLKRHAEDPETYRLYLNGIYNNRKGGQGGLRSAFDYYGQAVRREPGFALAYASLSVAQNDWVLRGYPSDLATFETSRENALCAVALDDQCARAHVSLGVVKRVYEWDWTGSEREFKRALELNPNEAVAHSEYATLLVVLGRGEEAVREARLGAELEPLALTYLTPVGSVLWAVRRFDDAIEELRKIVSMDPAWGQAHYYLVRAYAAKGLYPEARLALARIFELWGRNSRCVGMQALVQAASGERDEARASLQELVELAAKESVSPYSMALIHAQLGENDRAFGQLSRVVAERPRWWPFPMTDSMLDGLRGDPRWPKLLKEMGLG
jgi:serine/threonine-protein kinase